MPGIGPYDVVAPDLFVSIMIVIEDLNRKVNIQMDVKI